MRFPWANVTLLFLLLLQVASGYLGFVNGEPNEAWLLWVHGVGAYAITIVLFWKGAIVWDVLSRGGRWTWSRISFIAMSVLLLITLALGLLWSFVGLEYLFGFSLLSLHIYVAVPLILLLLFHVWRRRWILGVRRAVDRRAFLRIGLLSALGAGTWWLSRRFLQRERRFTGSYEIGSFGGRFPFVSWINDNPRPISTETWRLVVDGRLRQPLHLDYEQLRQMETERVTATIDCTGGWYSHQEWAGVPLSHILAEAGLGPDARSVVVRSVTGYWRRFALDEARQYLLATHVAGAPLEHGHGSPLRLVAPGLRGFNWVKWITEIRVENVPAFWQPPLPLQ